MKATVILSAAVLLASCSQSEAPSEEVEKAAEEVVQAVEGTPEPEPLAAGPFAPRDECAQMPGAAEFRREVGAAIMARDADALVALAADDVKLDFGGGTGKAELRRRLEAEDGALWESLAPLAGLGCAANSQGGMTLPSFFEQTIPVDPYAGLIVTGENVPLREAPEAAAPIIARLAWDAVEAVPEEPQDDQFRRVRLPAAGEDQEIEGYMAREHLRSYLDYRLIGASRNGKWRIISLIAGD